MTELWLKYRTESGDAKRVQMSGEVFTIGRQSTADLSISDGRLSREHVTIQRFGDIFMVSDRGSSNGTLLNGEKLSEPKPISHGDKLELGGLPVEVEIESDQPAASAAADVGVVAPVASPTGPPAVETTKSGNSMLWLLMIPMFGIVILLFAGVLIYAVMSRGGPNPQPDIVLEEPNEVDGDDRETTDKSKPTPLTQLNGGPPGTSNPPDTNNLPPATPSETAVAEELGAQFLRRIAQNDPKAFLTSDHAKRVDARAKQFKGSAGLAENINSARKNSSAIAQLAGEHNLKPQLLAVAAIARLGGSRGDIVASARAVSEILGKLAPQIGSELAEDSLLLIAAYDQGAAGETMKMRNMLQDIATKSSESPRTIRSIWFLEKEGKITKTEFEKALTFLAIGTITQNPKAYGVNAEALTL
jgi:hypothetical protein